MKTDKKIIGYDELTGLRNRYKRLGKVTVFTTGCYDILHLGHVIHFNYCKKQGDILIVSVGNDRNVKELKGPTRPINNEIFRARMIAALQIVDHVVISNEMGIMDHDEIVRLLKPNVYVVPSTDKYLKKKTELVENNGGRMNLCKRLPPNHLKGGISTTEIEGKLKEVST